MSGAASRVSFSGGARHAGGGGGAGSGQVVHSPYRKKGTAVKKYTGGIRTRVALMYRFDYGFHSFTGVTS